MAYVSFPALALAAAFLAAVIIYNVLSVKTSPLSKIPDAGFGAAYSRLAWAFPREYCGTITIDLPKLHKKLGNSLSSWPVATLLTSAKARWFGSALQKCPSTPAKHTRRSTRLAANSRKTPESMENSFKMAILPYFQSRKSFPSPKSEPPSLTDRHRDPEQHSKRRRIMGQLFSRSKVPQVEKLILYHVDRFTSTIQRTGPKVDLMVASRALEADIMWARRLTRYKAAFSFGKSIQAIDSWANGNELAMVAKNDEKATWMPILTNFPLLSEVWELTEHWIFLTAGFRTPYAKGLKDFQCWCRESWSSTLSEGSKAEEKSSTGFPNLIRTLVQSGLPSETALSEAKENLGPGTDTTSATLAHILWALAHNPSYQSSLYQDLAAVSFVTDMTTLENIPRLQACVKEGIRWGAAAAAMLPRIVPKGGIQLHGNFIPEGTVLTSSPIWYLHDDTAFPSPDLYDPYRWLTEDGQGLRENALRDRFYIPFSRGANVCMGAHFAYLELYISVSQIIRSFNLEARSSVLTSKNTAHVNEGGGSWAPVPLPRRREWVAAVPIEKLEIKMRPRGPQAVLPNRLGAAYKADAPSEGQSNGLQCAVHPGKLVFSRHHCISSNHSLENVVRMDIFDELEAMARAASLTDHGEIDDETVNRWKTLFGFSSAEAIQKIEEYRANPDGIISDAHWDMVRDEEESRGFDRETYEYSCIRRQKAPHRELPQENQQHQLQALTFLVKLEGPLSSLKDLATAASIESLSTDSIFKATDTTGQATSFCKINGIAKVAIEAFLVDSKIEPGFRPTFIRYSKARKSLSSSSVYPSLGVDSTLPQHRLQIASPRPKQDEYPVWYFYGTLANRGVLNHLLGINPTYHSARIRCGRLRMWGSYKALVDDPSGNDSSIVEGKAFQVQDRDQEETLQVYETDRYEVVRCSIELAGERVVNGLTFRFIGELSENDQGA
ncbi:hypothetical protein ACJZ2D_000545 [Fusarium nematophilum]